MHTLRILHIEHILHILLIILLDFNRTGTARHPASSKIQHQSRTHPPSSLLHTFDWPWIHAHLLMSVCGEEIAEVQSPGHGVYYTTARNVRG